jgi:hypothetical protein
VPVAVVLPRGEPHLAVVAHRDDKAAPAHELERAVLGIVRLAGRRVPLDPARALGARQRPAREPREEGDRLAVVVDAPRHNAPRRGHCCPRFRADNMDNVGEQPVRVHAPLFALRVSPDLAPRPSHDRVSHPARPAGSLSPRNLLHSSHPHCCPRPARTARGARGPQRGTDLGPAPRSMHNNAWRAAQCSRRSSSLRQGRARGTGAVGRQDIFDRQAPPGHFAGCQQAAYSPQPGRVPIGDPACRAQCRASDARRRCRRGGGAARWGAGVQSAG